jgi:glycosyltransferase involved in cell wall biosynthesis
VDRIYIAERLGRDPLEVIFTVNGVEPESVHAMAPRPPQSILFVGGWLDIKGRCLIPQIWNIVAERFPNARLTLVGTGIDRDSILPSFKATVVDRVDVIPRLTEPTGMRQQYEQHQILLMPSLSEGSSLSLLEAMAHGLTVVASTGGGNPDLIEDGVTGLLFDPFDVPQACVRLSRALSDADEARLLGMNARKATANFSWDASVARLRPALVEAAAHRLND